MSIDISPPGAMQLGNGVGCWSTGANDRPLSAGEVLVRRARGGSGFEELTLGASVVIVSEDARTLAIHLGFDGRPACRSCRSPSERCRTGSDHQACQLSKSLTSNRAAASQDACRIRRRTHV